MRMEMGTGTGTPFLTPSSAVTTPIVGREQTLALEPKCTVFRTCSVMFIRMLVIVCGLVQGMDSVVLN